MGKDFLEIVKGRRSTRQFSDTHLNDETIRKILEAAAYAPSSWGGHPVEFIVIRDKTVMGELARYKAMGAGPLAYGEAAVVPIINTRKLELWVEDAAVASTYILLAAEYYGVGACWIHIKGRKGHTGTAEQDIRALLGIPDHYGILNVVSLGMKKEPSEKRMVQPKICYGHYREEQTIMKTRKIGELTVSAVGMGCMAFSHGYGQIPPEEYSIEAIQNAYQHGCTFFDTAEIYSPNLSGTGHNERIVGKALRDVRKNVVLATKLFLDRSDVRKGGSVYDAVLRHLEASMDRLQTDMVDLYYLHRTNGGVSVEEVAEAMGQLIEDGLICGWGLSQVDVNVIDRAQRVTPLAAIQNIYSMVERNIEKAVIPYCLEHGIGGCSLFPDCQWPPVRENHSRNKV